MTSYNEYDWSDVTPIPHEDGHDAMATIAYAAEYAHKMSLLRAVMAADERSERALVLTQDLIEDNPAHYTVWEYRRRILRSLDKKEDQQWLDETTLDNPKNYQIWHHRESTIDNINDERAFCRIALQDDTKNYHAWSYLMTVVRGKLGGDVPISDELDFVNRLLDRDVRNNSAWNYRFFVLSNGGVFQASLDDAIGAEVEYAADKIALAPQNESPWNYLTGMYRQYLPPQRLADLEQLCLKYVTVGEGDKVVSAKSTHALELLGTIYSVTDPAKALAVYDHLQEAVPIRQGYWVYKQSQLQASA